MNVIYGYSLILECMECEENWKCNNVSVNVESLYSTLEIIQQGKKVGSVWDFLLLVYLELSIEM